MSNELICLYVQVEQIVKQKEAEERKGRMKNFGLRIAEGFCPRTLRQVPLVLSEGEGSGQVTRNTQMKPKSTTLGVSEYTTDAGRMPIRNHTGYNILFTMLPRLTDQRSSVKEITGERFMRKLFGVLEHNPVNTM
jgi:hypothetical protein